MDSITINGSNPVLTLDNAKAAEITSLDVDYLTQGMLWRVAPDGSTVPDLAESSSLSSDGLTLTINLRPGVKYSDGESVTAADVVAAYKHGLAGIWGSSVLASVKDMQAVSTTQVAVHLSYKDPDIVRELTGRAMAINPASKVASDPNYFNHPVSAGPYMIQNYVPGQLNTTLVENPNYWGGPMMVKKITVLGVSDDATRTLEIQSGQIDVAWKVPYASKAAVSAVDNVTVGPIGGYIDLYIKGVNNGVFDNATVRQAISLALDRDALSQQAYQGLLPARTSWLWQCGALCAPNLLPNQGKQDLDKAKQLLAQAGVTTPQNVTLITTTSDNLPDLAVVLQNQLKAIGINITIKQQDASASSNSLHTGAFQFWMGEGAQITPAAGLLTFFGSGGNTKYTSIPNGNLANLANQAKQELDPTKRAQLFTEVQTAANSIMPVVPLLERIQINAFSKRLPAGLVTIPVDTQILNIQSVAEAKAGKSAGQ